MKRFTSLLFISIIAIGASVTGYASEVPTETKIKIDDISVTIPYAEDDIQIIRKENFQEVKVTIVDANTGEEIRTIGEMKSTDKNANTRMNYNKTMYDEKTYNGCKVRLYADFLMYSSGSFAEIMSVTKTYWLLVSSGGWELKNDHSGSTKMAPNRFEVYGNAIIEVASTSSIGISAGYQGLSGAGFEMSGSSSSNWYARKLINQGFVYSI